MRLDDASAGTLQNSAIFSRTSRVERHLAAAEQDVGLDADLAQLLDRCAASAWS